jgi:pantoate--beta-alanine ligase
MTSDTLGGGDGPAVVRTVEAVRSAVRAWRRAGETVALIPTMGYLHDGHLALVDRGRVLCRRTVASLFVNPIQFGPAEDLARYPRDEAGDRAKLHAAGCDLLYAPSAEEMYPSGFATAVTVSGVAEGLCGVARPLMFGGVATVVTKLLLQTLPDVAVFGEKDYQQLLVVRRFVRDLDIPVRIEGVPTVREADGLALSSRNAYLTAAERVQAPALFGTLNWAAGQLLGGAEAAPVLAEAGERLLAAGFASIDYLELRDAGTLVPLERACRPGRLLVAAWLGRARLIDNIPVVPGTR